MLCLTEKLIIQMQLEFSLNEYYNKHTRSDAITGQYKQQEKINKCRYVGNNLIFVQILFYIISDNYHRYIILCDKHLLLAGRTKLFPSWKIIIVRLFYKHRTNC